MEKGRIVDCAAPILITGSSGFIGSRVVESLLALGFTNLRCFVRPSSNVSSLEKIAKSWGGKPVRLEIIEGNLLSPEDCEKAARDVSVIYHLAAGRGEKSYPNSYMNSVVTTRNLLEVVRKNEIFRRFVNVSSFTVYSTEKIRRGGVLTNPASWAAEGRGRLLLREGSPR
jgi:nucleoside-diphosphate-sugar epimerase